MFNSTRSSAMPLVAAAVVVALAWPARAEFNPAVRWLMNQPVSLWDRGMDRMEEGVDRAANDLRRLYYQELFARIGIKNGDKISFAGSRSLDWENNEILIGLSVIGIPFAASRPPRPPDHKICNTVRQFFLSILMFGQWHFPSRRPAPSTKKLAVKAHGIIALWFSHIGYKNNFRDKKLEAKLARMVFVQANIYGRNGEGRFRSFTCKARITEWDAPSKPLWQDKSR